MPKFALTKSIILDASEVCQLRTSNNICNHYCMYQNNVCQYINYIFDCKPKNFYMKHTFNSKEAIKDNSLKYISSENLKKYNEELKEVFNL